jgi:hypothetical protein
MAVIAFSLGIDARASSRKQLRRFDGNDVTKGGVKPRHPDPAFRERTSVAQKKRPASAFRAGRSKDLTATTIA